MGCPACDGAPPRSVRLAPNAGPLPLVTRRRRSPARLARVVLLHAKAVVNLAHARHGFGAVLGRALHRALAHGAFERHFAVLRRYLDVAGVDVGIGREPIAHFFAQALVGAVIPFRAAAHITSLRLVAARPGLAVMTRRAVLAELRAPIGAAGATAIAVSGAGMAMARGAPHSRRPAEALGPAEPAPGRRMRGVLAHLGRALPLLELLPVPIAVPRTLARIEVRLHR